MEEPDARGARRHNGARPDRDIRSHAGDLLHRPRSDHPGRAAPGLPRWREALFALMHHNAQRPGAYFKIPGGQIMEIGVEFEIWARARLGWVDSGMSGALRWTGRPRCRVRLSRRGAVGINWLPGTFDTACLEDVDSRRPGCAKSSHSPRARPTIKRPQAEVPSVRTDLGHPTQSGPGGRLAASYYRRLRTRSRGPTLSAESSASASADLRHFRRRRKAFERGREDGVGVGGAGGRLVELR